ncbi:sugar ABC transporter substrate-binding protein [Paenibacillaceae bacterium WGS1546]|uniref:sugar ABC transporter substrate-binding protein n=1 Tax=Cohnella sp. WGS1546 TaxID=3366810 RepID=UPI00372D1DAC
MNKKTYKLGILALALSLLMAVISACGTTNPGGSASPDGSATAGNGGDGSSITAGVVLLDLKNPFYVRMQDAGTKAGKDYGIKTVWQSADGSLEKQISIVENFIEQKVDVILIDPQDAKGIVPVIDKATKAGIPVITMGNKVEGNGNYNTLYPDYENEAVVARIMGTALDGKGEVGLLTGNAGNYVSDNREKGFVDTMTKEFPDIKVTAQPTNFDPAQAQRIAETWLNNANLDAIAFINDPLGLAAKGSADAKGVKLLYAGYDGDVEMHDMINSGEMLVDVLTGAERVGYWNVAAAARIAKGAEMPIDLFMPTYFVMSDDTAAMLKDKGLEIEYITPEQAVEVGQDYSNELGPDQPDERISGAK